MFDWLLAPGDGVSVFAPVLVMAITPSASIRKTVAVIDLALWHDAQRFVGDDLLALVLSPPLIVHVAHTSTDDVSSGAPINAARSLDHRWTSI
jgi:hypothetical protein